MNFPHFLHQETQGQRMLAKEVYSAGESGFYNVCPQSCTHLLLGFNVAPRKAHGKKSLFNKGHRNNWVSTCNRKELDPSLKG